MVIIVYFTKEDSVQNFSGTTMGTYYNISVVGTSLDITDLLIHNTLEEVNQEMSTYIPSSFISKFNEATLGEWIESSPSFIKVLSHAIETCNLSDGYFDVTVGGLVNIWGFGPSKVKDLPSMNQIINSLQRIGCDAVSVNFFEGKVKRNSDVKIDLSAIAKGFAIDQLYDVFLEKDGVTGFLIEIGGEIKAYGYKSNNIPWTVGISHPDLPGQSIFKIKTDIKEIFSMATSGDYRNFKLFEDKVYSHTINPKDGMSLEVRGSSVSVISDSAMKADALATALNAMGPEKGMKFANQHNLETIFLLKENGEYIVRLSESFKKTLQ